jgi:large subunit ribosomal protein L21
MYAIIRTGGKQYHVAAGDTVRVEKLQGEVGDTVELSDVLLVADGEKVHIGQPVVEGVKVVAKIVDQGRAKKILVFKKKRRKTYQVLRGHRQQFTALSIEQVVI